METAMINEVRDTSGKFAPKSEVPRKVRSVNLTDDAWQWLAAVAEKAGMSRNDYLEALAFGQTPFMETAKLQPEPFIETAKTEREVDGANIEKQPDTELYPFIETVLTEVESVKLELEAVRAENQLLQLGNSSVEVETLNQELASVREQLEAVQAENEKLKASQPAAQFELPEAADLYNQLKAKRKKATASLADIEAILEILEELTPLGGN
jgi:murein L,D-transpeptidase YcbB/YkuD